MFSKLYIYISLMRLILDTIHCSAVDHEGQFCWEGHMFIMICHDWAEEGHLWIDRSWFLALRGAQQVSMIRSLRYGTSVDCRLTRLFMKFVNKVHNKIVDILCYIKYNLIIPIIYNQAQYIEKIIILSDSQII